VHETVCKRLFVTKALSGPFRRSAVLKQGLLSRYQVDRDYVRLYPDVYVHKEVDVDAKIRARAVWCWSGGQGSLAGWSAAAMLGVKWIDNTEPGGLSMLGLTRSPAGLELYRERLNEAERQPLSTYDVTTPERTAFDLGRRLPLDRAVEAVDAIYQATGLTREQLTRFADSRSGARGLVQLRRVIELSDEGAESVWETKTRLAIIADGFPRPESQLWIYDDAGRFIGRTDLGWRKWRVLVEYDGDDHFNYEQRNRDVERWNALEAAGWRVIRVKKRQLMHGRALLMGQIRQILREAGAPGIANVLSVSRLRTDLDTESTLDGLRVRPVRALDAVGGDVESFAVAGFAELLAADLVSRDEKRHGRPSEDCHDHADQGRATEAGGFDVETALTGMCAVAIAEDDREGHEVGDRGDERKHTRGHGDEAATTLSPAQAGDQQQEKWYERADRADDESGTDTAGEALVGDVADLDTPPARNER
jgi:hypothetical protein